jgi:hypothetical protein
MPTFIQAKRAALLAFSVAACVASICRANAVTHYDAVKGFSTKANPSAVWSYHGFGLLAFRHSHYKGIKGIEGWSDDNPFDNTINIRRNKTGQTVVLYGGNLVIPTDHLLIDDEASDGDATVQFQAPKAGVYKVRGDFKSLAANGPHHVIGIDLNNAKGLLSREISHGNKRGFDLSVTMAAGDTLQFFSARNVEGEHTQTGLAARIVGP